MKYFIILSLLFISLSYSQSPINYKTKLIEKDGILYLKDNGKPYFGSVFSCYDNGKTFSKGNLMNGRLDGLWTYWYENEIKMLELTWKDGVKDGLYTEWYDNGEKKQEGIYKNDLRNSEIFWTEDSFNSDKLILYYKYGDILLKGNLDDNTLDGQFIEYGYFGNKNIYHKRILKNYKDGKLNGEYIYYFDNGDVNIIGNYKYGKLEGECTYFDLDGKIYWKGIYKDDVLIENNSFTISK